jgi:hypothetical protein
VRVDGSTNRLTPFSPERRNFLIAVPTDLNARAVSRTVMISSAGGTRYREVLRCHSQLFQIDRVLLPSSFDSRLSALSTKWERSCR